MQCQMQLPAVALHATAPPAANEPSAYSMSCHESAAFTHTGGDHWVSFVRRPVTSDGSTDAARTTVVRRPRMRRHVT